MSHDHEGGQSRPPSVTTHWTTELLRSLPLSSSAALLIVATWYLSQTFTEFSIQVKNLAETVEAHTHQEDDLSGRVQVLELIVSDLIRKQREHEDEERARFDNADNNISTLRISERHH